MIDVTVLNMRSIAADQRKHGGKCGRELAGLIEAWSDQRATLLSEKAATARARDEARKAHDQQIVLRDSYRDELVMTKAALDEARKERDSARSLALSDVAAALTQCAVFVAARRHTDGSVSFHDLAMKREDASNALKALNEGAHPAHPEVARLTAQLQEAQQEKDEAIANAMAKLRCIRANLIGDGVDPAHPPTAELARLTRQRAEAAESSLTAMRGVLNWLDRVGGLGHDAHARIAAALSAPVDPQTKDTP